MRPARILRAALGGLSVALALASSTTAAAASRGSPVLLDEDASHALVADPDGRALHVVDLATDEVVTTPLGATPGDLALLDDGRVAVALRDQNALVVVDRGTGRVLARQAVPADPWGLAVTPSGDVLVTSTWGRAVTALSAADLSVRWSVGVAREPRGVVVSPDGARAWVTHLVGDALSTLDLVDAESPRVGRASVLTGEHRNRVDAATGAGTLHPSPSLAFSIAASPDGHRLFVPHRLAQNGEKIVHATPGSYGGVAIEEDTTIGTVTVVDAATGRALGARLPAKDPTRASLSLSTSPFSTTAVAPAPLAARQLSSAVVVGDSLLVTSLGTGELFELDARALDPSLAVVRVFRVGRGAAGVDARPGIAVAFASHERGLTVIDLALGAVKRVSLGPQTQDPVLARGRALFHDETDRRISRDGRACAGCHPEGRDDGVVWHLGMGPRQTPTLLGRLSRGPFGWNGKHETLTGNVTETIGRLGGRGLDRDDAAALVAYLERGLAAPTRTDPRDPRAAQGRALFLSQEVGCAHCHDLAREGSDRARWDVGSRTRRDELSALRTPPLSFVGETAPYFHDGRYQTLEELIRKNPDSMGRTMRLTDDEVGALAAFLRTL